MKIYKTLNLISKKVNYLPFSGKLVIKPLIFRCYNTKEFKDFFVLLYCVFFMSIGYMLQSYAAFTICVKSNSFYKDVFLFSYIITNIFVIFTQYFLLYKVFIFINKYRHKYYKINKRSFSNRQINNTMIFTLSAQSIFIAIFFLT